MSQVHLTGYIMVPEDELALIKSALISHIELTRAEPGCLYFEVTQDDKQVTKFHVNEAFVNQQAFDVHQQRVRSSSWAAASMNIARHYHITHT